MVIRRTDLPEKGATGQVTDEKAERFGEIMSKTSSGALNGMVDNGNVTKKRQVPTLRDESVQKCLRQ